MTVTLLPAVEQLALLQQGKISAVELAEEYIRRIERLNPSLNAFIEFDAEAVRTQARRAASGRLAGLPLSLKSTISIRGYRREMGSLLHRGLVAEEDAEAVVRLRAA